MSISRGGNGFALLTSYRKGNISIFSLSFSFFQCGKSVCGLTRKVRQAKALMVKVGGRERERKKENIHNGGLGRENAYGKQGAGFWF